MLHFLPGFTASPVTRERSRKTRSSEVVAENALAAETLASRFRRIDRPHQRDRTDLADLDPRRKTSTLVPKESETLIPDLPTRRSTSTGYVPSRLRSGRRVPGWLRRVPDNCASRFRTPNSPLPRNVARIACFAERLTKDPSAKTSRRCRPPSLRRPSSPLPPIPSPPPFLFSSFVLQIFPQATPRPGGRQTASGSGIAPFGWRSGARVCPTPREFVKNFSC